MFDNGLFFFLYYVVFIEDLLFSSTYILVPLSEHIGGKMGVFLDQRRMFVIRIKIAKYDISVFLC